MLNLYDQLFVQCMSERDLITTNVLTKMAPNIREMLVCEACGYIADRENVLAEICKGVQLLALLFVEKL